MSYTKGPWTWNMHQGEYTREPTLIGADGEEVCDFGDSGRYYPTSGWAGSEEDMRLIACAPELLELLKEARDSVAECANYEAQYESHRPDRAIRTMKTLEAIDAIIAKAEES